MRRNRLRLLAVVVAVGVTAAVLVGVGAVRAATHQGGASLAAGNVIESSFVIGRGPSVEEITAQYWALVGQGGEEEALRARLVSLDGAVLQDGVRRRADGYGATYHADTGEVVRTPRSPNSPVLMWTPDSVKRGLLDGGYELVESTARAGVPTLAYEKRSPATGRPPFELLEVAGISSDDIVATVRRVFVGSEPFGVDLGEEAGYVLSDGTEFIPYYRRIATWEVLDGAPAGVFDWSPPGAGR